jgi:HSP20 family protein
MSTADALPQVISRRQDGLTSKSKRRNRGRQNPPRSKSSNRRSISPACSRILRQDQLEDFDRDFWGLPFPRSAFDIEPFWRGEVTWAGAPAVDVSESEKAYEITAELPGMDEKNIEVKLADGGLTIKGEKQEDKEEKKEKEKEKEKEYYLHERRFGSFERCFRVPEGVDTSKIEATFKKGVLTVTLPKSPEAQKAEKKIEVKAAA